MGHLHDHVVKNFNHLGGPVAYPGSIELTNSEGIKETKKGFYQVDISSTEAKPSWVELNTRPQFSIKTTSTDISKTIDEMFEKIKSNPKKPIVEIKIESENVEQEIIQAQISRLIPHTLHCSWKLVQKQDSDSSVLLDRPARIDEELFKLAVKSLKSEKLASFAVKDLLPILSASQIEQANQLIIENFERFKKEKQK